MEIVLLIATILTATGLTYSQERYTDNLFDSVVVTADIAYSQPIGYNGTVDSLSLDLYEPYNDPVTSRPLLILIHGGAFYTGTKDDPDIVALCDSIARKGYVTASLAYRIGFAFDYSVPVQNMYGAAIVRAVEDAKSAVRFLTRRADTYSIDPGSVFLGGMSAGGITSVLYACMEYDEILTRVDTTGLTNRDNPEGSESIAAIVNLWGGTLDSTWLENESTPVLNIHGTQDAVVPYDAGIALGIPQLTMCGSAVIHRAAQREGFYSELHSEEVGHGEFNTGYIVPRLTSFLTKYLGSDIAIHPSVFSLKTSPGQPQISRTMTLSQQFDWQNHLGTVYNMRGQLVPVQSLPVTPGIRIRKRIRDGRNLGMKQH